MRVVVRPGLSLPIVLFASVTMVSAVPSATLSLDGDWNFVADPSATLKVADLKGAANPRPTRVPSSWQSQFADLRDYAGVAWYWRSVQVEMPPPDHVLLLRFGAVDYRAEVFVNGQKAGSHDGGYLPFEFDVTGLVRAGENQVAVRVVDPGPRSGNVEGINYDEIPHGKQNWYVQTSGLWQSVELDVKPRLRLGTVHIRAAMDGSFKIEVPTADLTLAGLRSEQASLRAEIHDPRNNVVWQGTAGLKAGLTRYEFSGHIANPGLWSPASPVLYGLRVELSSDEAQECRFGFRTFETRGGKFYLNGRVIYLRGALDQAFYPDTIYTPPSLEYLKSEMQTAKSLGLNLLRCHIKVPDPRYLQAADEAGVLVWYEIPNWDKLTDDSKRRSMKTLRGMVERDWNHPSIVIVSLINESWGANLKEVSDREWLKQAYVEAKASVPGWLVDDNSACCDNFHLSTDLADFHTYDAIPDHAADFDRFVSDLATRPGWLFSPYGDGAPRGDEPLMLSEFGNWGLPRLPQEKPWWFARGFGGREITLPEGVEKRFADYQYSSLFSFDALLEATDRHQAQALKYEIETLRSHPEPQGYVITEFTDIDWEANGLLSMWRQPKNDPELLRALQRDDLVVVRAERRNYATGEKAAAEVFFSHFSQEELGGATVKWELEGSPVGGTFSLPAVPVGGAIKAGGIQFSVPAVTSPSARALKVRVTSGDRVVSENSVELFFYPPEQPELPPPVAFEDPDGKLRRLVNEMRARGYQPPAGGEAFPVMIASRFDDRVKQTLQGGGRVILLANDHQTLAPGVEVVPRAGSDLDGNWISGFLWLRKTQEPFKRLAFDALAGFETQAVTPGAVVRGVPPERFGDVLSGVFYGWIHSSVGTLVQARYGKGKLLICTFSLATTYASDAYATYLLDGLINYVVSGFSPTFEIPIDQK